MRHFSSFRLQRELVRWTEEERLPDDRPYTFATFTLKQALQTADGFLVRLTRDLADREMRWFERNLNQRVFGRAARRFKKRLLLFDAHEGGDEIKRAHRHLIIETPKHLPDEDFHRIILDIWLRSPWSHRENKVDRVKSLPAALRYVTKGGIEAIRL